MKKFLLLAVIAVLCSFQAFSVETCTTVYSKVPILAVSFDEPSVITNVTLSDGIDIIPLPEEIMINESYYEFHMSEVFDEGEKLDFGKYYLSIGGEDLIGNPVYKEECYILESAPLSIELLEPKYGVTATPTFTFKIGIDRATKCRYSTFADSEYPTQMGEFDDTGYDIEHEKELSLTSDLNLYVVCEDNLGDVLNKDQPAAFTIRLDTTAPVIERIYISPGVDGVVTDFPLSTNLNVVADEKVRCKYSEVETEFERMDEEFDNFYTGTFSLTNTVGFSNLEDGETYTQNIMCENEALLRSGMETYSFSVNTNASERIVVLSPPKSVKETPVNVLIQTVKMSKCQMSEDGEVSDLMDSQDDYHHSAIATTAKTDGEYKLYFDCIRLGGYTDTTVSAEYTYYVDNTGPVMKNITAVETCDDESFGVEWAAEDALSGIAYYEYKVEEGVTLIQDWTRENDNELEIEPENASSGKTYAVIVRAVDNAGNVGAQKGSGSLSLGNPDAEECSSSQKPIGRASVSYVNEKLKATLTCTAGKAKCNPKTYRYGTAVNDTCVASKTYTAPVDVQLNSYFCWIVRDYAGNADSGLKFVELPQDSDGDGVPDDLDECPDTEAGEDVDSDGCSDQQRDSDDDGINDADDRCPSTPSGFSVDSEGCRKDTDNDGMPDDWEIRYGLDPFDDSDAELDFDEDGYTNLEEYQLGSDPTDPTDPEPREVLEGDLDGDGVMDDVDECPGTPVNEAANEVGCSRSQIDTDGDGMPDYWEDDYGLDPTVDDSFEDPDGDGLSNFEEYQEDTDPTNEDTDYDGYSDGDEVNKYFTDPLDAESKPESKIIPITMMILGLIAVLGGAGYIGYKTFYLKKDTLLTAFKQKGAPAKPIAKPKPKPIIGPILKKIIPKKPKMTLAQKRKLERRELRKKRALAKTHERSKLFESFSGKAKEEKGLRKIELPKHVLHRAEVQKDHSKEAKEIIKELAPRAPKKPLMMETPAVKIEPEEIRKVKELVKEKTPFGELNKLHIKGAMAVGDKKGTIDALSKLQELNAKRKQKAEAFGKLAKMMEGKKVAKEEDVFKLLPDKLKAASKEEAKAFNQLSNLVSGKEKELGDLLKESVKPSETLDNIKKIAKKKGRKKKK